MQSLLQLVRARARVRRGQRTLDIDGEEVVPGDLLLVESGDRMCADVRLLEARALRVDESVLTGESVPVEKDESFVVPEEAPLAERRNMAFAGSMVASGPCTVKVAPPASERAARCITWRYETSL